MNTLMLALILPGLPLGELPDPEVSTNVTLATPPANLASVALQIEFAANPAHEIAVAVGTDADEDGCLAFEETAFVFGNDCGSFYFANLATRQVETVATNAVAISGRAYDRRWNLAKIVKRGPGAFEPIVSCATLLAPLTIRIR